MVKAVMARTMEIIAAWNSRGKQVMDEDM